MGSTSLFTIATLCYFFAMIFYIGHLAFRNKKHVGLAAFVLAVSGFVLQTGGLLLRWRESYQLGFGRVPLSNLYESLIFFSWCTVLIYLLVEWKYRTRAFGAFVMPVAFLALAFINVAGINSEITPLVPALKSNWLFYHVLVSFLGYAAFAVAFAFSMIFLLMATEQRGGMRYLLGAIAVIAGFVLLGYFMAAAGPDMKKAFWYGFGALLIAWFLYIITTGAKHQQQVFLFWAICVTALVGFFSAIGIDLVAYSLRPVAAGDSFKSHLFEATFLNPSVYVVGISWLAMLALLALIWSQGLRLQEVLRSYLPSQDNIDEATYRMIAIGWPLLTGGIITGSVWANTAWGSYWSWDPKETWSLITWFIYAIYLHARYMRGWKGRQMAVLAAVGFFAVLFTYLGVNLVLSGLHSYGAME